MSKSIIIAIDGFSSSGKSSMARQLAKNIGYKYVDSGAMYRAMTLYALEHGMVSADGRTVDKEALVKALPVVRIDFKTVDGGQRTMLNGNDVEKEIRSLKVSNSVSPVAAIPEVRHALVKMQQAYGRDKCIVMDGRDIGTTVFPDAELKIFVNASAETRAMRRFKELSDKGEQSDYESVLENIRSRDHIDMTRAESPLRRADDAIDLDNSQMTIEEQNNWLLQQFKKAAGE